MKWIDNWHQEERSICWSGAFILYLGLLCILGLLYSRRIRVRSLTKTTVSFPRVGRRCVRMFALLPLFIALAVLAIPTLLKLPLISENTFTALKKEAGPASRLIPGIKSTHTRHQHYKPSHSVSVYSKESITGVARQRDKAASRIVLRTNHTQLPHGKPKYKGEHQLQARLSVEVNAQRIINRFRAGVIARIIEEESVHRSARHCSSSPPDCPRVASDFYGRIDVKKWLHNTKIVPYINLTTVSENCSRRHAVAIIIPYRDREKHLSTLLTYLPPILERQQLAYHIFVVEQMGNGTFNKALLMNAGASTALEFQPSPGVMFHCLIFHDVDMLPEDDRIPYSCPQYPRHLSVAVDTLDYCLPYYVLVGGVFSIRTEHFLKVNGYSNLFWGWGGEDDDMGLRVVRAFGFISRPPEQIARYTMVKHTPAHDERDRHKLLRCSGRRYLWDGLNTAVYRVLKVRRVSQVLTRVFVDVGAPPEPSW